MTNYENKIESLLKHLTTLDLEDLESKNIELTRQKIEFCDHEAKTYQFLFYGFYYNEDNQKQTLNITIKGANPFELFNSISDNYNIFAQYLKTKFVLICNYLELDYQTPKYNNACPLENIVHVEKILNRTKKADISDYYELIHLSNKHLNDSSSSEKMKRFYTQFLFLSKDIEALLNTFDFDEYAYLSEKRFFLVKQIPNILGAMYSTYQKAIKSCYPSEKIENSLLEALEKIKTKFTSIHAEIKKIQKNELEEQSLIQLEKLDAILTHIDNKKE